jgi:exodeoxyribonuclease III
MRIVTWNCQTGFDKKADALLSLNPDVAVVQECSEKSTLAFRQRGYESLWFGSNSLKGLGVFSREDWSIRALSQPEQKWIVPVEVDAPIPFTLIAVWACRTGINKADNYVGLIYQALMSYTEWFNGTPVILAGDLNSNKIWDCERVVGNHSDVVRILAERGLVSGYHEFFGEAQGAESRPTFNLFRHSHRPFHLDYIFLPQEWAQRLKTVDVGEYERWSKLSDHCPVTVEI